jgi:hypothetical protein
VIQEGECAYIHTRSRANNPLICRNKGRIEQEKGKEQKIRRNRNSVRKNSETEKQRKEFKMFTAKCRRSYMLARESEFLHFRAM